jgi:hypothetical protein
MRDKCASIFCAANLRTRSDIFWSTFGEYVMPYELSTFLRKGGIPPSHQKDDLLQSSSLANIYYSVPAVTSLDTWDGEHIVSLPMKIDENI